VKKLFFYIFITAIRCTNVMKISNLEVI